MKYSFKFKKCIVTGFYANERFLCKWDVPHFETVPESEWSIGQKERHVWTSEM